jgi:hypothetical protein
MKKGNQQNMNLLKLLFLFIFVSALTFSVVVYIAGENALQSVLTNPNAAAQEIIDKCMEKNDSTSCYAAELGGVVRKSSLSDAIGTLESIQDVDTGTLYCHFIAHKITRAAVLKEPDNWLDLFSEIDMAGCSNGYFHGILEGYLYENPNFEINEANVSSICRKIQNVANDIPETEKAPGNCAHAIGHILLVDARGDSDMALAVCSTLKSDFRYPCFRGVFMEATEREALVMHEISTDLIWDEENTLEFQEQCSKYHKEIARACWQAIAPMYATISDGNYEQLYRFCQSPVEQKDRDLCYIEGASHMAFLLVRESVNSTDKLPKLCEPFIANINLHGSCVRGVASFVMNGSPRFIDKLHSFCAGMDSKKAHLCYREVTTQLRHNYGESAVKSFCDNARSVDKLICGDVIREKSTSDLL